NRMSASALKLFLATSLWVGSLCAGDAAYAIPKAGEVVAIGVNHAQDVAATVHAAAGDMPTILFGAFGGGTFVRDYSSRGAYVFTAMGGHAAPMQMAGA